MKKKFKRNLGSNFVSLTIIAYLEAVANAQ